jgi:hypothetical protein
MDMDRTRCVVVYFDAHCNLDTTKVRHHPGSEVYLVGASNAQIDLYDEIDMELLNDLHRPVKLAFVGGDLAKEAAEKYWATWARDTPAATEEVVRYWGTPTDVELPSGSELIMIHLWDVYPDQSVDLS